MRDQLAILILLATVVLCPPAEATTYHVRLDETGDFQTIQEGLDAARTGDSVLVAPGTYFGANNSNLDFYGKDIVLVSEFGPDSTIIEVGEQRGSDLRSRETPAARIEGFTIRYGSLGMEEYGGAGILCVDASPTIHNCIIEDCWSYYTGGGIEVHTGSPMEISMCTIRSCFAGAGEAGDPGEGGGLYLDGPVTVEDCLIADNFVLYGMSTSGVGGGVYCRSGVTLTDCVIENNSVINEGPSLYGSGGGVAGHPEALLRCRVAGNYAGEVGGGLNVYGTEIIECLIAGNWSRNRGAGLAAYGDVTIRSSTIAANYTGGGDDAEVGGGIWIAENGMLEVERSILWGNCAEGGGDDLHVSGNGASARFSCSAVDLTGLEGEVIFDEWNVFEDPLFCDPVACESAPTTQGDYALTIDSPCLPGNHPDGIHDCGLIGALPIGCPAASIPETVVRESPGAISLEAVNPFRSGSSITVTVTDHSVADDAAFFLHIHDVSGRALCSIYEGNLPFGSTPFRWDGTDDRGHPVAAGVYYFRVRAGDRIANRRFVFLR